MPRTARKEHPISMRLPEEDLSLIDRAASLKGRSRTDFVREAAVRAAEDVLMENLPIRMSARGFAEFSRVLAARARPVPELEEILSRTAPWEVSRGKKKS